MKLISLALAWLRSYFDLRYASQIAFTASTPNEWWAPRRQVFRSAEKLWHRRVKAKRLKKGLA